jgi:hypothetical protein
MAVGDPRDSVVAITPDLGHRDHDGVRQVQGVPALQRERWVNTATLSEFWKVSLHLAKHMLGDK